MDNKMEVLVKLAGILEGLPWLVGGSTAGMLQGAFKDSNDIDIITDKRTAYEIDERLAEFTVQQVAQGEIDKQGVHYASHFGTYEIDGVEVEVIGDLVMDYGEGTFGPVFDKMKSEAKLVEVGGKSVPVEPLEYALVLSVLRKQPDKSRPLADFLLKTGFDKEYLLRIIENEKLPEKYAQEIKGLLKL